MKITHVIHGLGNPSAGPTYSLRELATGLADRGNQVSVLTLPPAPSHWPDNVELKIFDGVMRRPIGYSLNFHREIRRISLEPSILYFVSLWRLTNLYSGCLRRSRAAKIVVAPRGSASSYTFQKNRLGKSAWWYLLQRPALTQVDCFHATAVNEYEDLRAAGIDKPVCVIPNGIDIPPILRIAKPDRRKLLFLGRINHVKGVGLLLPIWRRLQETFPDWDLTIAGPLGSSYANQIMADARNLGCERITFPGQLLGDAKARAYAEADLFVLPTYSENFGLVIAEALSHGVPVVTTRGAPWPGLHEHRCGWWTEIEEASIYAGLSEAMSKDRRDLSEMGQRGRDWMARDYSWPQIVEKTQITFEWLLHGAARPSWVV